MSIRNIAAITALVPFLAVLQCGGALAASFDCGKAVSAAERQICADPDLSQLDTDLAKAYAEAVDVERDPKELRSSQREWLRKRDRCLAGATDCGDMSAFYRSRMEALSKLSLAIECNAIDGVSLASCASRKTEATEKELTSLIAEMKKTLVYPDAQLVAQKAWEDYREKECRSRISLNGSWGGGQYQECLGVLAKSRLEDLRNQGYFSDGLAGEEVPGGNRHVPFERAFVRRAATPLNHP